VAAFRKNLGRKVVRGVVRHSWRGFVSKAQRQPLRSAGLLGAGGMVGLAVGWLAGRRTTDPA
jgi:hypothetical protein